MALDRKRLLRIFGSMAAALALALGIRYWATHRKVRLELAVEVARPVQAVEVLLQGVQGVRERVHVEGQPGTHRETLQVPQGEYDLLIRVVHLDGSRAESRRRVKLRADARLRLRVQ